MDIVINGYPLDKEQLNIATTDIKNLLVVAGAGAGKTQTILGRIYYLVNKCNVSPKEILCISYTRDASLSLKEKLKREFDLDMNVYTFHKLAINILRDRDIYFEIASKDTLELIIEEYLKEDIINNKEQLNYLRFILKINWHSKEEYLKILDKEEEEVNKFINVVASFIRLIKCMGNDITYLGNILTKVDKKLFKWIDKYYLLIIFNIYLKYNDYLKENRELDFDDLIIKASEVVKDSKYVESFKYIIIDEYQDSSYIRFNLIKRIVDINKSYFMAVGDDFQAIYRFSGSDIGLFLNFKKYFPKGDILKIQTTYRNSNELIKVAGDFVMKNKLQIRKDMKSSIHIDKPIKIIYYNDDIDRVFYNLCLYLDRTSNYKDLLVLSRNNKDINKITSKDVVNKDGILKIGKTRLEGEFMTIHRSKGLERSNVIMINLVKGRFPCDIEQNKILNYIRNEEKKEIINEERRLFYVGLTRTKNFCYLLVPKKKPSIFIEELLKNYKNDMEILNL